MKRGTITSLLRIIGRATGIPISLINIITSIKYRQNNERMALAFFGTARSGTTWLAELLLSLPGYKLIYEPFNPDFYPHAKKIIRSLGFYLRRLYIFMMKTGNYIDIHVIYLEIESYHLSHQTYLLQNIGRVRVLTTH